MWLVDRAAASNSLHVEDWLIPFRESYHCFSNEWHDAIVYMLPATGFSPTILYAEYPDTRGDISVVGRPLLIATITDVDGSIDVALASAPFALILLLIPKWILSISGKKLTYTN